MDVILLIAPIGLINLKTLHIHHQHKWVFDEGLDRLQETGCWSPINQTVIKDEG